MRLAVRIMLFCLVAPLVARGAAYSDDRDYPFPAGGNFSSLNPVVYPTAPSAALSDPAVLPYTGKARTLELANAPTVSGSGGYGVFAGAAKVGRKYGVGLGYLGDISAKLNHGFFASGGYNFGPLSLGLAALKPPVADGPMGGSFSIARQTKQLLRLAATVTQLGETTQSTIGLGVKESRIACELDVQLPPFNDFTRGYTVFSATTVNFRRIGVYGAVGYQTTDHELLYTFGASTWMGESAALVLEYSNSKHLIAAIHVRI